MRLRSIVLCLVLGGAMLPAAPAFAQGSTRAMLAAPSPAQLGRSVIMTAEVDALSRGAPTGSVTFFDGPTPLGSVTLSTLGAGQATLAAGAKHSCALTNLGGVKCWGYNGQGQLGNARRPPAPRRFKSSASRAVSSRWRPGRSLMRLDQGRRGQMLGRQLLR